MEVCINTSVWIGLVENVANLQSDSYFETCCFTKFFIHHKWNDARLLSINIIYQLLHEMASYLRLRILRESQAKARHLSHVTKSRIFKNLNLRKKANRNFRRTLLKNRFRHLKLYSNATSRLARGRCHMGTFWKRKDWSSHLWQGQPFRHWYVEFHRQRRLNSTKTGISSWF